jgi:hypothetical protein
MAPIRKEKKRKEMQFEGSRNPHLVRLVDWFRGWWYKAITNMAGQDFNHMR